MLPMPKHVTRAVGTEYATFRREQGALQGEIGAEIDLEKRRALELRKGIEAAEYMVLVSQRLANIDRVISDRKDSPQAALDEAEARAYNEQANELRQERESLLYPTLDTTLTPRDSVVNTSNAREPVENYLGNKEVTDARARRLARLNDAERQVEEENRESPQRGTPKGNESGDRSR
jgi:hypothetical protein